MMSPPQNMLERIAATLRGLAERPGCLLCLLLALNALARPYAHFHHDARLYAFQTLNRVTEQAYSDDLFFRFGSQDQYSLFSVVLTPLTAGLGLEVAFFVVYLAANVLFLFALKRFVEAMVPDRAVSTLALFFLVMVPQGYLGYNVLQVHERFLTPRIIAVGFTMLALEQLYTGRFAWGFGWLVVGSLFHPLMGLVGWLVAFGWVGLRWLGPRWMIGVTALATAAALGLLYLLPDVSERLFGVMDPEWRSWVRQNSAFLFPEDWAFPDWLNLGMCFAAVIGAACFLTFEDPRRSEFLWVIAAVGVLCFAGALIAGSLPYALPFKAQVFRGMWLLKVLQAPLAFGFARRLWRVHPQAGPIAAIALLTYFGVTNFMWEEWHLPLIFLPLAALCLRGISAQPARPGWLWQSLAVSLYFGLLIWGGYKVALLVGRAEAFSPWIDPYEIGFVLAEQFGAVGWMTLALFLATRIAPAPATGNRFLAGCLGLFALIQLAAFLVPRSNLYQENWSRHGNDVRYVKEYLQQHARNGLPTVYSGLGDLRYVWLDLRTKSYFDTYQLAGIIFHRETAAEGKRRARVVEPFERERFRKSEFLFRGVAQKGLAEFFAWDPSGAPPKVDDLLALAQDPNVDVAVLRYRFDGLYAASNSNVYIYDCKQIRSSLPTSSDN